MEPQGKWWVTQTLTMKLDHIYSRFHSRLCALTQPTVCYQEGHGFILQKPFHLLPLKRLSIHVEESFLVAKNPSVLYIEASEVVIETPFQAFKLVIASYVLENSNIPRPLVSKASNMMENVMLQREILGQERLWSLLTRDEETIDIKRQ